jgi:general secretion pathway protein C
MRRQFRLVYAATAAICAALVIEAWATWIEPPPSTGVRQHSVRPARVTPRSTRGKNGALLADRNMFCSTCDGEAPPPPPDGEIRRSALPLDLIATNVTGDRHSFATIRHQTSMRVGAYREGDAIPAGGRVEIIRGGYVVIRNDASDASERLDLIGPRAAATERVSPRAESSSSGTPDPFAEGITRVDDTHFEVDRELIQSVITDPRKVRGGRVSLSKQGIKVFGVRAGSAFDRIGLQSGDLLADVNGMSLDTPDKLLEIYAKLATANNVSVTVRRGGVDVTLSYLIR